MWQLTVTSELAEYADWPHLAQVFVIERTWLGRGKVHLSVHYAITSLPDTVATAATLLRQKRGHWRIENGLHYVRDVTLNEDKSTIHVGNGASVVAALRNTALDVLRRRGLYALPPPCATIPVILKLSSPYLVFRLLAHKP